MQDFLHCFGLHLFVIHGGKKPKELVFDMTLKVNPSLENHSLLQVINLTDVRLYFCRFDPLMLELRKRFPVQTAGAFTVSVETFKRLIGWMDG